MILTKELLDRLRPKGCFTAVTLRALDVPACPQKAGWVDRLIGKEVSKESYQQALLGVGVTRKSLVAEMRKKQGAFNFDGPVQSISDKTPLSPSQEPRWTLYCDGGCFGNGFPGARASWVFWLDPGGIRRSGSCLFPGKPHTNNRGRVPGSDLRSAGGSGRRFVPGGQ